MPRRALSSYASAPPPPDPIRRPKIELILDSGAYSAWRLGKPINIDEYCDYLLANRSWITTYVCLDVINPDDPEAAAAASWENFLHMRKRGLDPMPVYHVKEDVSWLFRMLDAGCKYIGLSASSLVSRNQVDDWYALAWQHLVTRDGSPVVKCHAFGEGRADSLIKFPWYSADTTSWIYSSQRAAIAMLPGGRRVGVRNDKASISSAPDLDALGEYDRLELRAFMERNGLSGGALDARDSAAMLARTYITALYYRDGMEQINKRHPIKYQAPGLFSPHSPLPPVSFDQFKFFLVIGNNTTVYPIFAVIKYPFALASYFYIKTVGQQWNYLREFVYDPLGTASQKPFDKYWNQLAGQLTDAKSGSGARTLPVQAAE